MIDRTSVEPSYAYINGIASERVLTQMKISFNVKQV